ncbi:hypothetical protein [Changchengzhania lutea]|uniref:hypothetical protein n=1 Tax=Changchengzhania lutea TaxID=2049305 RepID=UPI00163DC184|nr:hypothetical protein [Changchengzhania lutea]
MPDKKDKGSLNEDQGRRITERPNSEPIIKSDVPDFGFTPPPPEPNTDRTVEEGKKE